MRWWYYSYIDVFICTPRKEPEKKFDHCSKSLRYLNHVNVDDGAGFHFHNIPPKQPFDVKYNTVIQCIMYQYSFLHRKITYVDSKNVRCLLE